MLGPKMIRECKGCGRLRRIQNKALCLCQECVYRKNHGGLNPAEISGRAAQKRALYKYRRETGERDFFLKIWEERPHYCTNCGKYLGDVPRAIYFSHKVAKSVEEDRRLDPANIDLLCGECHYARDFRGKEAYEERRTGRRI